MPTTERERAKVSLLSKIIERLRLDGRADQVAWICDHGKVPARLPAAELSEDWTLNNWLRRWLESNLTPHEARLVDSYRIRRLEDQDRASLRDQALNSAIEEKALNRLPPEYRSKISRMMVNTLADPASVSDDWLLTAAVALHGNVLSGGIIARHAATNGELTYSDVVVAINAHYRHVHTNYDDLLASGVDKDSAREHMRR